MFAQDFYPCRLYKPGTTCCMREAQLANPQLPRRPFCEDGHCAVTRGQFGRIDL